MGCSGYAAAPTGVFGRARLPDRMHHERLLIRAGCALAAIGAVLWVVSLTADATGLGGQPGFNWKQTLAAELGLLAALVGVVATRGSTWLGWPRARPIARLRLPRRRRQAGRVHLLRRLASPEGAVIALALTVIGVTTWWLSQDARVPNGDSGRHMVLAFSYLDNLENGTLFSLLANPPVIDNEFYPPVGHLVGSFASLLVGFSPSTVVLAENLVFVPLLALGCYGAGRQVFGRRAGALAALFALSVPILVSQWHVFQLDAPQTAAVAVGVWLLLLSDRFGHLGYAALAGLAIGVATMIKVTTPLFLAGFVLVMLVRGGWRNWRGAAVFGLLVLAISQPWILQQEDLLRARTDRAIDGPTSPAAQGALGNYSAYLRGALTVEYYLPLCALFAVGAVVSTRSWIRERRPAYLPELLLGVIAAYVLVASMSYFNDRYIMPALVFLAVLGTGWIASLPRPGRFVLTGLLLVVFALNTVMISTGLGGDVDVGIPGTAERLVLISDVGYVERQPLGSPGFRELIARARERGAENVIFEGASLNTGGTNLNGLAALAFTEGLYVLPESMASAMGPRDIFMIRRTLGTVDGPPCFRLIPPEAVYVYRGGPPGPTNFYCP